MAKTINDTSEVERVALASVIKSKTIAGLWLTKMQLEMFTGRVRPFIFAAAMDLFVQSSMNLTEDLFRAELDKRVDEEDRPLYLAEWGYVVDNHAVTLDGHVEKLLEAMTARRLLKSAEKIARMATDGDVWGAVEALKNEAVHVHGRDNDRPTVNFCDADKRRKALIDRKKNPDKYVGLKTGFQTFDQHTGGMWPGELVLVAGLTGTGKSTLCKAFARGIVTNQPKVNVLHIANEEYQEQVEHKYDALFTGMDFQGFKYGKMTGDEITRWDEEMADLAGGRAGRIFIKEVPAFSDMTLVERAVAELHAVNIHIGMVIVDHLPHVKPIQKVWSDIDEQTKAASDVKEVGRICRVPVLCPTQAATAVAAKQEKGNLAGPLDVHGSKGQVHVSNVFMMVTIVGMADEDEQLQLPEWQRDVYWCCDTKKNRDGAHFRWKARHEVRVGRLTEVYHGDLYSARDFVPKATTAAETAANDVVFNTI